MQDNKILILLVLTLTFLFSCSKDENTPPGKNEPYDKNITAITIQGQYTWIGTYKDGLYRYDGDEWIVYTISDGLVCDSITALNLSGTGGLWIGTKNGISKLENQSWTSLTEVDGLYNNDIRCLALDQQNNLWIGTRNNRVVVYDGDIFTAYHVNPVASGVGELGHIHTITHDHDGNVWIGSCISGLSKFDDPIWSDEVNNLTSFIESSICTPDGDIWVGNYFGAYRLSNDVWTMYTVLDGLASNQIRCFTLDQQDNIWIGTDSGLSVYDGASWTNYTADNGLVNDSIKALACDEDGNIWVGTYYGLYTLILE